MGLMIYRRCGTAFCVGRLLRVLFQPGVMEGEAPRRLGPRRVRLRKPAVDYRKASPNTPIVS